LTLNFPDKKYKIIYADPPWAYGNFSNMKNNLFHGKPTKFKITPYQGMNIKEIKDLSVQKIADINSVLLLWITFPCLQWGLDVVKAWGFEYKTVAFTWVKKNKSSNSWFTGLGNYTRANAEICLLSTKGKGCKVLRKDISQICDLSITKHSQKPDEIRKRIIKLFGDLPRIELFARTKVHGWDVIGNDEKLQNQPLEDFNAL